MKKTNLFLVGLLIVVIVFALMKYKEGFYSTTDTSRAKNDIDDLLSTKISTIKTMLKEMNTNKYSIDITSSISSLSAEMKNSSLKGQNYIRDIKGQLSDVQKNLNTINDAFVKFTDTSIEQVNGKSTQTMSIIDAVNNINDKLRKLSNDLSEIPE